MFSSCTFLSLLLIAVTSANSSPIERDHSSSVLGFASKIGALGTKKLVDLDRARASALIQNAQAQGKRSGSVPVANSGVTFDASVYIGSPPTECSGRLFGSYYVHH